MMFLAEYMARPGQVLQDISFFGKCLFVIA